MELGEGLCKLRKMNFESGPFHQFEKEISAALDFIYQTQLELAACKSYSFFISSFIHHGCSLRMGGHSYQLATTFIPTHSI